MLISIQCVPSDFHLGDKRAFLILGAGGVSRCQSSINLANTKFQGRSSFATPFFSSFLLRIRFLPNLPFQKAESQGRKDKRSNFHFFWQNSMPTMEMGANWQWIPQKINEDLKPLFLLGVLFSKWQPSELLAEAIYHSWGKLLAKLFLWEV